VRGRILLREQWANSLRLRSEVAVAYDEFTPDILENRLLKAAIERIRRIRIAESRSVWRWVDTRVCWAMSRINTMPRAEFPKCTSPT
jgi:hypothetical protein